jgi:hypothetical protein
MVKEKNIIDLSVTELKAVCFDLDQEIKLKQNQFSQVVRVLQDKIQKENEANEVKDNGADKK